MSIRSIRSVVARALSPIVWRVRGHSARKLLQFSRAERASELDLRLAAALTSSDARRALYLAHALDESRHAVLFAMRANELRKIDGHDAVPLPEADTESLFERLGELRFLAFVHRGEQRGHNQFVAYRDHFGRRGDDKSRAMFNAILVDEDRHRTYTRALLVDVAGSERAARRALARAATWEAWRTWRRAGRFLAERAYGVAMAALFVLLAPLAWFVKLRRPAPRGWH
ncbi:MAG TPA: ferritin-like domain-containing protein [Myxococcota bacterium]